MGTMSKFSLPMMMSIGIERAGAPCLIQNRKINRIASESLSIFLTF